MPRHPEDPDRPRRMEQAGIRLRAGHSYNETAKRYRLPVNLLRETFPGLGYRGQRKPGPTEEQKAIIRGLFAQGLSRADVSRITDTTPFMLAKYFPGNKWTHEDVVTYAMARKKENQIGDGPLRTV